jgi:glutamate racemase
LSSHSPIGVFDSGIGGLTVLKALTEKLPSESFVYFGDTARVPYGTKSDPVVKQFALQDSLFLLKHDVKLIVVACNTASSVALDFLKQRLALPLIGVIEPGAKSAIEANPQKPVGIIGTRATIASGSYQRALKALKPDIEFIAQPCPLFVPLVEEGLTSGTLPLTVIEYYLQPLKEAGIGNLILGCTHYPLLKPALEQYLGPEVAVIDASLATAQAVKDELETNGMLVREGRGSISFYASDISPGFLEQSRRFFGGELPQVEKVEFEVADFWV